MAYRVFVLLLVGFAIAAGFAVPPAASFIEPELARIVFVHLPCALITTGLLLFGAWASFRYLRSGELKWDRRALVAMELGFLLGVLTLLTGMIFARVQWNTWWEWREIRMTSFLLVVLILGAYFAIRSSFSDSIRQAKSGAAYILASVLPIITLTFIAPRLPMFQSLHPDVARQGGFDSTYRSVFLLSLSAMTLLVLLLFQARMRTLELEQFIEEQDAELANRDRSPAPRVVRPVSLPPEG